MKPARLSVNICRRQGFQIDLPWLACYVCLGAVLYADSTEWGPFEDEWRYRMALASVVAYGASELLLDLCAGVCTHVHAIGWLDYLSEVTD